MSEESFFRFLDNTSVEGLRGHLRTLRECYPADLGWSRGEQLVMRCETLEAEIKAREGCDNVRTIYLPGREGHRR